MKGPYFLCCGAQKQIVLVSLCESYHILLLLVFIDKRWNVQFVCCDAQIQTYCHTSNQSISEILYNLKQLVFCILMDLHK